MARFEKCVLCGLALFVLIACAALFMLAIDTPSSAQQDHEQTARAAYDECAAKLRAFGLDIASLGDKPETAESQKRDKADLCQQIRMADAAKESANTAWLQLVASVLGLVGLFWTVRLTAKASKAAAEAAKATAQAVDVQVRTERPLLYLKSIKANIGSTGWQTIETEAINLGKTPAILIRQSIDIADAADAVSSPQYQSDIVLRGTIIAPDNPFSMHVHASDSMAASVNIGNDIILYGYFRYEDVFGRTRQTGFGYLGQCNQLLRVADGFITYFWSRFGGEAYNYDREEPENPQK